MKVTPYGMDECCICDAPTTHASPDNGEWLPYCAACMAAVKAEFPTIKVALYSSAKSATKREP